MGRRCGSVIVVDGRRRVGLGRCRLAASCLMTAGVCCEGDDGNHEVAKVRQRDRSTKPCYLKRGGISGSAPAADGTARVVHCFTRWASELTIPGSGIVWYSSTWHAALSLHRKQ